MNKRLTEPNDSHGLTGIWHDVPREQERSLEFGQLDAADRQTKLTRAMKIRPDYGSQLRDFMKKSAEVRAEKKRARDEEASKDNDQVF
jgi:hypothetical protein